MKPVYTEIAPGFYEDQKGNHFYDEKVLRYRVFEKPLDGLWDWRLVSSHFTYKDAETNGGAWCGHSWSDESYQYKIVDNGTESYIKRLMY